MIINIILCLKKLYGCPEESATLWSLSTGIPLFFSWLCHFILHNLPVLLEPLSAFCYCSCSFLLSIFLSLLKLLPVFLKGPFPQLFSTSQNITQIPLSSKSLSRYHRSELIFYRTWKSYQGPSGFRFYSSRRRELYLSLYSPSSLTPWVILSRFHY